MISVAEIKTSALLLPIEARLQLASDLLESIPPSTESEHDLLSELSRRDSEMENGSVQSLTEAEFWAQAKR
jgi:hypothetical protein